MKKRIAIIGAGPGGYTAAVQAAEAGAEVTLVENEAIGGVCLHRGCIPSKIMKHTADLLDTLRKGKGLGLTGCENVKLDMMALQQRKKHTIQIQQKAIDNLLDQAGVKRVWGHGTIAKGGKLQIALQDGGSEELGWDKLIVATGSSPLEPKQFPVDGQTVLSSNDILNLEQPPRSIIIIGGGVIGCEFATILRSFGTDVTIVEARERLLPLPSVAQGCSKVLERQMKKRSVQCLLKSTVHHLEKIDNGIEALISPLSIQEDEEGCEADLLRLRADKILICIGRAPLSSGLGLHHLGVDFDRHGWIMVNEYLATSNPDVYAIGDILGPEKIMLAHMAIMEGKAAAENAMGGVHKINYNAVPTVIFSNPEIGCVGLTEQQAIIAGENIKSETILFRSCGKAHVIDEIDGLAKIVANADNGRILGMHIIGPHASDLIGEGALAVKKGITVRELAETVHAHPTLAEIMMDAAQRFV